MSVRRQVSHESQSQSRIFKFQLKVERNKGPEGGREGGRDGQTGEGKRECAASQHRAGSPHHTYIQIRSVLQSNCKLATGSFQIFNVHDYLADIA